MNKEKILEILKEQGLDTNNYIVISGASMVLLGIKETTSDIDIAVKKDYYNYLLKNYNCTFDKVNMYNNKVYFIDNIINFGIDYYSQNYTIVDGIKVQNPEEILKLKKILNRNKDKKDIKLIETFISSKV